MVLGKDRVVLREAFEDLLIGRERSGRPMTGEELTLGRRVASALHFGIESNQRASIDVARALIALLGPGVVPPDLDASLFAQSFKGNMIGTLERALQWGLLRVEIVARPQLEVLEEPPPLELPPRPPLPREGAETVFEIKVVDEIGQAVSGLILEFEAPDDIRDVTTNAAGIALMEGVRSHSARAAIPDLDALEKKLDPRWQTVRPGRPPKESNQSEALVDGAPIGPLALKSVVQNTLVLKPLFGDLLLELSDKRGRIRHKERPYRITGPVSLSGVTDERGVLSHPGVPNGDYQLELDVEVDLGEPAPKHDLYVSPAVVLRGPDEVAQFRGLGAVPRAVLGRLKGLAFDTNKAFLLPSALPGLRRLRELLLAHSPAELLIVGHTDTSGEPDYNEKLSLERAKSMAAFLKDDVDAWLAFYESAKPEEQRWGAHEDAQMLLSLPDFSEKGPREEPVRWFQRTRLLEVDGVAGPETRKQLIAEYMQRDGVALGEDPELSLEITCHGCGENFPLDDSGEELDTAAADGKRDALDRRVELYLFDPEFGIQPPPPGELSKAGSSAYPAWRKRAEVGADLDAGARRLTIRILDDQDTPQDQARYRVRLGRELHLGIAKDGIAEIATASTEDRCLLEWSPKDEAPLPISGGNPRHSGEVFVAKLAAADPIAAERMLHNLGYQTRFGLESSVLAFQRDQGLTENGELDEATAGRLDAVYTELSAGAA